MVKYQLVKTRNIANGVESGNLKHSTMKFFFFSIGLFVFSLTVLCPHQGQCKLHSFSDNDEADASLSEGFGNTTGERLYNGIVLLPEWQPQYIDTEDTRPMPVPYLDHPPALIPIDVGRQLFVDDFLIETTNLERTFYMPEKYEGIPVLQPETAIELTSKRSGPNAAAVPKDGCVWWDSDEAVFKMWYEAGSTTQWIAVKSGKFMMGAEPGPDVLKPGPPVIYEVEREGKKISFRADAYQGPHWDERPIHEVTISSMFEISQRVTLGEFLRYKPEHAEVYVLHDMDTNPASPVTMVTWDEAQGYSQWLGNAEGAIFRLPTEAEWEYAAGQVSTLELEGLGDGLMEWCYDWWAPYAEGAVTDPLGPADGLVKVLRNRLDKHDRARITDRSGGLPGERRMDVSFRVARVSSTQGTHRSLPPLDTVFRDVSQEPKEWQPVDADTPIFHAGGFHIDRQAGNFDAVHLPYWGRHHVPTIVYSDNGDLLMANYSCPNDGSDQMVVLITRLRDGAERWDPPARFFILPDRKIDGPILHRDDNGVLSHFNAMGTREYDNIVAARHVSLDNGATWSRSEIVPFHLYNDVPVYRNSMSHIHMDMKELDDGTWVMQRDVTLGSHSASKGTALFKSTDRGMNWHEMSRVGWNAENYGKKGEEAGWIAGWHAPLAILRDGSFLAIGRENNIDGRATLSRSKDQGRTWSYEPSEFSPLISSQRPIILRLAEGPLMIIWYTDPSAKRENPDGIEIIDAAGKPRRVVGAYTALSFDEGASWSHHKLLPLSEDDPYTSALTGYYTAVQSPDGLIHLANTSYYWRFNLAWLKEPMSAE